MQKLFESHSLGDTIKIGEMIASNLDAPASVYLNGSMGAGKTTLIRAILAGLGYTAPVTSPTYNLIHEYPLPSMTVYHMDLYRLEDPQELEYLAIEDLWREDSLFLIEWPERGAGWLPKATATVQISPHENQQSESRMIAFERL
ncbi:tRNA (adenosine(37)-N6)-threonylcarbamoyltransferase complex ATPase subunit type 1 TsaE [Arenicella chitinivorans]|uniref:tRNA threonylcarbamoyladenosine biosynthesis protein TsaE n=2 Tax=Arenicella chitinivorans TaxID=1329800 RepID=A0A918VR87_9GAMM|nr:tRNA (adenosine(37)-N6)-threonylcarbamoyltransferase complex ATPase subunit type 1 TsaE [Arenicella chitinivorans]